MECLQACVASDGWWALLAPVLMWAGYWTVSRLTDAVPVEWAFTYRGVVVPAGVFWHRFWGNASRAKAAAPAQAPTP